jgi:hypothetical protein
MGRQQLNQLLGKTPYQAVVTAASGAPFHVTFTVSGIEITGRIDSVERADEVVRAQCS